jgi:RNA recognition motif-containing protein
MANQKEKYRKNFNFFVFEFRYGEVVNVNLIRDKKTGKSKGYGFLCYEDQRSTDLAVDNFNGTKVLFC